MIDALHLICKKEDSIKTGDQSQESNPSTENQRKANCRLQQGHMVFGDCAGCPAIKFCNQLGVCLGKASRNRR